MRDLVDEWNGTGKILYGGQVRVGCRVGKKQKNKKSLT